MPQATPDTLTTSATLLGETNKANYAVPAGAVTKCNIFLRDFAQTVFNYHGFDNLTANDIYDLIVGGGDWTVEANKADNFALDSATLDVAFAQAQNDANAGYLVVVAMKVGVSGQSGGHVAVCVPGATQGSGQWINAGYATALPLVAQAGKDVFGGKGLSYGITPQDYFANEFAVAVNKV